MKTVAVLLLCLTAAFSDQNLFAAFTSYEKAHPEAVRIAGGITQTELLRKVEPAFPESVRKKRRQLSLIIAEMVISKTGKVIDPKVLTVENEDLHKFVIDALRQWKYKPATKNGKSLAVFVTVTVHLDPG